MIDVLVGATIMIIGIVFGYVMGVSSPNRKKDEGEV